MDNCLKIELIHAKKPDYEIMEGLYLLVIQRNQLFGGQLSDIISSDES